MLRSRCDDLLLLVVDVLLSLCCLMLPAESVARLLLDLFFSLFTAPLDLLLSLRVALLDVDIFLDLDRPRLDLVLPLPPPLPSSFFSFLVLDPLADDERPRLLLFVVPSFLDDADDDLPLRLRFFFSSLSSPS